MSRVPKAGGQPPRWIRLAAGESPDDDYAEPAVMPRRNGSLEVFAPVSRVRIEASGDGTIDNLRLFRAVIQGGRPRTLPPTPIDSEKLFVSLNARILGTSEGEPHALHAKPDASLAWVNLARLQEKPAGQVPTTNYFHEASTALDARSEVYLVLPLQNEDEKSPRLWIGSARIGEPFAARGVLTGSFSPHRKVSLAVAPRGEVYLVASLREPEKDDGQVALWNVSGAFPPEPILTPWLDRSSEAPQAVFVEDRKAAVAWDRNGAIHVETFALPER